MRRAVFTVTKFWLQIRIPLEPVQLVMQIYIFFIITALFISSLITYVVMILVLAEGILFGFGGNKMAQLGQGHQKPVVAKPVQVQVWWWNFFSFLTTSCPSRHWAFYNHLYSWNANFLIYYILRECCNWVFRGRLDPVNSETRRHNSSERCVLNSESIVRKMKRFRTADLKFARWKGGCALSALPL